MNKGLYGYPLPPNVATRVAPAEWRNQLLLSNAGSGNFTVPQNVFQVQVTAIGGGANGCHPYYEPLVTGRQFHFSSVQRIQGTSNATNTFGVNSQLGSGLMAVCDDGTQVFTDTGGNIYRTADVRVYSTQSTLITVPGASQAYVYRSGSTILAVSQASSGGTVRSTDGGLTFTAVSATNVPISTIWGYGVASLSNSSFCGLTSPTLPYYTTDTGTTFTSSTLTGSGVSSASNITAGAGLYVVVGATTTTNGGITTSPTGATWTARTSNSGGTTTINNVRFLNNLFIAVGNSGYLATSSDGISWTLRTTGTATALYDVAWDGTRYVAVGNSSTIIYSSNLSTWTAATKDATAPTINLRNVLSPASGVFFTYIQAGSNGAFNGIASFDGGLNWYGTLWTQYADTVSVVYNAAQIVNEQIILFAGPNNELYVSVLNGSFGGGGGGFATGIIDVMPGQTLSYVVGAAGGTSSVGTVVSATGGNDRIGGTGIVANTVRGAAAYSGGNGGVISLNSPLTAINAYSVALTVGGGGGGSCGWYGFNGGNSPTVTQIAAGSAVIVSGGLGGAGLGGAGGGNSGAANGVGPAGGGGGYRTSGADATTSNGGGGGGSVQSSTGTTGGNGFSCLGGTGATTTPNNGGAPVTQLTLDVFNALRKGIVDGAGGGGGTNSTGANYGGNGSGFGGGGGGTGDGSTAANASSGGTGSPGGGGGGGGAGAATASAGLFARNGGDGGAFAGGGGAGGAATAGGSSFAGTYNAYGGNGGLGAGGGGVCITWSRTTAGVATTSGIRLNNATQRVAGSKTAGAPGAGGNGVVVFEWTEGY